MENGMLARVFEIKVEMVKGVRQEDLLI